jgi:hypothetical protein
VFFFWVVYRCEMVLIRKEVFAVRCEGWMVHCEPLGVRCGGLDVRNERRFIRCEWFSSSCEEPGGTWVGQTSELQLAIKRCVYKQTTGLPAAPISGDSIIACTNGGRFVAVITIQPQEANICNRSIYARVVLLQPVQRTSPSHPPSPIYPHPFSIACYCNTIC